MSKEGEKYEGEFNHEIEEIVSRIQRLSLALAPMPPKNKKRYYSLDLLNLQIVQINIYFPSSPKVPRIQKSNILKIMVLNHTTRVLNMIKRLSLIMKK